MKTLDKITCFINDLKVDVDNRFASLTLAEFLRYEQGLTGTKIVCAEGDCGACTVLIKKNGKYKTVNSCIVPVHLLHASHVVTVEGVNKGEALHPVQKAMIDSNGAQCGYCTPGFICSMASMVDTLKTKSKEITEKRVKNYLTGNLCRCTGYQPIINAACSLNGKDIVSIEERYSSPSREAEIKELRSKSVNIDDKIFLPVTIEEALTIKSQHPEVRIVAGATDVGVVVNKGKMTTPKIMSLYLIKQLGEISNNASVLNIGATATLSDIENYIEEHLPQFKTLLHIFASPQIKNQGTLAGNVVNASPIGDSIPFLLIAEATIHLRSLRGKREVPLTSFYLGYKKLDIAEDEIVTHLSVDVSSAKSLLRLYKVSLRKDLDISAVTFAVSMKLDKNIINHFAISLGGVGPTVMRLTELEALMVGKDFTRATFEKIGKDFNKYITPLSDLRASKEYRLKLCENLFLKYYDEVSLELSGENL